MSDVAWTTLDEVEDEDDRDRGRERNEDDLCDLVDLSTALADMVDPPALQPPFDHAKALSLKSSQSVFWDIARPLRICSGS
ncbi:hypothetical protein [Bradyrhizobium liaoningense]